MEQRFAFVLRVWVTQTAALAAATDDLADGVMRGTLQTADSPAAHYFSSFKQLNQLLLAALQQGDPFLADNSLDGNGEA